MIPAAVIAYALCAAFTPLSPWWLRAFAPAVCALWLLLWGWRRFDAWASRKASVRPLDAMEKRNA